MAGAVPAARNLLHHPALREQLAGSDFLQAFNRDGDVVPGARYTVVATRYDEMVVPCRSQFLLGPGVDNVLLQDVCPLDTSEHWAPALADPVTFHLVTQRARPGSCHADHLRDGW
ncbi:hypothetical protein ACH4PU_22255 [Streptomyces sp. NPDC021100]|uniref:hypothetical protein n=1 Tax=Streptomyces sp. NPDC021100 TaxID=3365114 RepID=UPI0037B51F6A